MLGLAKANVRGNLITTYRCQRGNYKNYKTKLLSLVPDDLKRGKATNCSLGGSCATLGKTLLPGECCGPGTVTREMTALHL